MFVVNVPYGISNETNQVTIYLGKKKRKKIHTSKNPFTHMISSIKIFHMQGERRIRIKQQKSINIYS